MCGRFTLTSLDDQIADLFEVLDVPERSTRYNIAPTQNIIVITRADVAPNRVTTDARKVATSMRWGLVPHFAKSIEGLSTFNARSETVTEKPTFSSAFEQRRCLIPADGFYEWANAGSYRQPYRFVSEDRGLFAFAGLWDRWVTESGETLLSATILTTTPNSVVEKFHDRMPVILDANDWGRWLAPDTASLDALALLKPCPDDRLTVYPVDVRVGNVSFESPSALERAQVQGSLF